jgi:O-methyltransferase involved in polyketide biosynthesis
MDLSATSFDSEALTKSSFKPIQRTVWIAEGLLMYLKPDVVSSLMRTLKSLSAPGSQFVFTFMEKRRDGRIRFDSQSKLVDWWLRRRGESFIWGATRPELVDFLQPWRVARFFDQDDLRELTSGLTTESIAKGEVICLADS